MDKYNDISFEIGGKMVVLIEHQSTINPNMALRMLMYISDVYKTMVKKKSIYTSSQISIPYPEFFVLYAGTEKFPEQQVLHLSDLFEKPVDLGLTGKNNPLLELEVKVININEGKNIEIVNRCKKLSEYSIFISKFQEFLKMYKNRKRALRNAIKFCHEHDILVEFLEIHGRRVLSMLYEWKLRDAKKVWKEEAREEGLAEGREEGLAEGREEGLAEGRAELRKEKYAIAHNLLAEGSSPEFVQKITGLSLEEIAKL